MKNNYLVTVTEYGGDNILIKKNLQSDTPLSYEDIKNYFSWLRVMKIEILEVSEFEKQL